MSWVVTVSHYALCCHQETLLLLAGCWSWQPSLTAYKASLWKPQAFGGEVPSKYGWHPIVHLLQDLQAASLNSQHLAAHKTSLYKTSHAEMPRKPLLGNQWVLLWLWYWESTSGLLVSAIHFICCLPLGPCPRDLAGISSQHTLATEDGLLCCGKESSIPHRYFLSQIHPLRMNWWTSYLLQENKLDPLSRMNAYEHYSCRNLPGHSGHLRVFSFPFCMPRELGAAKKASGYLSQGWG